MAFSIENEKIIGELEFGNISISPNGKEGYRPFELFVAALIGCSGTLIRNILTKKRIDFEEITMNYTSVRNPDEANRMEQLTFIADVQSNQLVSTKVSERIADLVIKNCGMIQSVLGSIEIKLIINVHPPLGDTD